MKNQGVFVFGFLVISALALSNGAPQSGTADSFGSGRMDGLANIGFSASAGASGSGSASGNAAGSGSGSSSDFSSLVKRDLVNHAPIAHHVHSASCFGRGGGQGPPPGPPPNGTSSG